MVAWDLPNMAAGVKPRSFGTPPDLSLSNRIPPQPGTQLESEVVKDMSGLCSQNSQAHFLLCATKF